jgi:hypothetical protein
MKWFKRLPATGHASMTLPKSAMAFMEKAEVLLNTTLSLLVLKTFALDRKGIEEFVICPSGARLRNGLKYEAKKNGKNRAVAAK